MRSPGAELLGVLAWTVRTFWRNEQGQDLIEYALLLAFLVFGSAALCMDTEGSLKGNWSSSPELVVVDGTAP